MDVALPPLAGWFASKGSASSPEPRDPAISGREPKRSLEPAQSKILIVEDDPHVAGVFKRTLVTSGYRAMVAASASAGIAMTSAWAPDLVILDLKLPDMPGLALLRLLRLRGVVCRALIVSGFLTEYATDDQRALGVVASIAKPISPAALTERVTSALGSQITARSPESPKDVVHRWAALVLHACEGDADVRTIDEWGHRAGVSASTLREVCRLVEIAPHDARDLARLLNALFRAHWHDVSVESMLDVSDRRTLDRLLVGAALEYRSPPPHVTTFLERQRWVPGNNAAFQVLRAVFSTATDGNR